MPNALQSSIREYNVIYDNVQHMIRSHEDAHADLDKHSKQLQALRYMHRVKNIYTGSSERLEDTRPFYLIGFHLTTTGRFGQLLADAQDRALYYIKEFLHTMMSESFPEPITLQMEKDLILCIAFPGPASSELLPTLQRLKLAFDQDKDICYLTIAVRPMLYSPGQFEEAYDQTMEMIHRRRLNGETQIIAAMPSEPLLVGFSPGQEKEFLVQLESGNGSSLISLVERQLAHMDKIGATALQFSDFMKEIIAKTIKAMMALHLDISTVFDGESPYESIRGCASVQDYLQLSESFLSEAAMQISIKKNGTDPGKNMMIKYVNENYHTDLSLEMVADALNVSVHYISKYFKDKIGVNFLDYVTELRISKAKELLLERGLKIQDIAEQVGYTNTNSFIRMFRKATGMSPGEYRKQRAAP